MVEEHLTEKITVYITPTMKEQIQELPKSFNISGKLRNYLGTLLQEQP